MDPYTQQILSKYQHLLNPQPQKTPQQIEEEQQVQAYQMFLATDEGKEAQADLKNKFLMWHNTKHPDPSKEVSELKSMMETMAKQSLENQNVIASMAKQIEGLSNQLK